MKRFVTVFLVVALIVSLAVIVFYASTEKVYRNVFDEIYGVMNPDDNIYRSSPLGAVLDRVSEEDSLQYSSFGDDVRRFNLDSRKETNPKLREGDLIYFCADDEKGVLSVLYVSAAAPDTPVCYYSYDVKWGELSYTENVSTEDDMFLYDIVLPEWFNCSGGESDFSIHNLGEFNLLQPRNLKATCLFLDNIWEEMYSKIGVLADGRIVEPLGEYRDLTPRIQRYVFNRVPLAKLTCSVKPYKGMIDFIYQEIPDNGVDYSDGLWYRYTYDVRTDTLTYDTNDTKEEYAESHPFLTDKLIPQWLSLLGNNVSASEFSLDNLGNWEGVHP